MEGEWERFDKYHSINTAHCEQRRLVLSRDGDPLCSVVRSYLWEGERGKEWEKRERETHNVFFSLYLCQEVPANPGL